MPTPNYFIENKQRKRKEMLSLEKNNTEIDHALIKILFLI